MGLVTKRKRVAKKVPVGTRVLMRVGSIRYRGTVVEDRGDTGFQGRRIVAIRIPPADKGEDPRVIDWPLEELSILKTKNGSGKH